MYLADSRGRTPGAAEPQPTAARGTGPGRRHAAAVPGTVLALGTVSLITDVSAEMVTAVLPLYLVTGLGLSPLGFGLLDGVYNGVGALVRLLGGHLADRGADGGRHKAVAVVGYGLSALCKPALLAAHTLPLIGAVLAADRTGKGLRTAPRDALISLSTPARTRGRAFGVHRAMDTAGALLGPIIAFLVLRIAVDGYDAVFAVSSCVAALGVLVLVLFVPARAPRADTGAGGPGAAAPLAHQPRGREERESGGRVTGARNPEARRPAAREPAAVTGRAALDLLRQPELRRLIVCAVLLGLTTVSDSFLHLLLQRRLDLPVRWFPLLPLGTAACFLLLAVPLGAVADRVGRRQVFLAGHLGLLAAYGLLIFTPTAGTAPTVAVLALHGAFYAATDGVLMAAAAGAVPPRLRGSGLALVGTGQALARFACSLALGAVWTAWGGRTALASAAVGLAVCAAASAFLLSDDGDGRTAR
ncbi:MFS transporter [Wenjunlia tyrosinilytica]|uniref:MFS transporter n=1 Tax=Wenjunlia tyrosinilytica TaxID=1544741 RepID=UPI0016662601|nr:MFS transporter [Wenjunlia tyrosinilytica]